MNLNFELFCRWFAMQSEKEILSLSVTPSGCSMFQELALRLHALNEALALPLFNQAWRNLASQLDLVINKTLLP